MAKFGYFKTIFLFNKFALKSFIHLREIEDFCILSIISFFLYNILYKQNITLIMSVFYLNKDFKIYEKKNILLGTFFR